jgi:hypothetical protein
MQCPGIVCRFEDSTGTAFANNLICSKNAEGRLKNYAEGRLKNYLLLQVQGANLVRCVL